jgi:hypothetical protein
MQNYRQMICFAGFAACKVLYERLRAMEKQENKH